MISKQEQRRLERAELVNSPANRVPVLFCIDCSLSMRKQQRIQKINQGLAAFIREMQADPVAVSAVDLCLVAFGGEQATVLFEFGSLQQAQPPVLVAGGATPLGGAVTQALDRLEERLALYWENGISHYCPWLLLMSDGLETDPAETKAAAQRTRQMAEKGELKVLAIRIGEEDGRLDRFTPDGVVHPLDDLKYDEFFAWISRSVQKMGYTLNGEQAAEEDPASWEGNDVLL